LLQSLEGVTVIGKGMTLPAFDCHLPLMSLPHALGLADITDDGPYLAAEPGRVEHWSRTLGSEEFRVGIAWQGNPRAPGDPGRSIPLREFLSLARVPDVRLISLQKHDGLEQLADLPADLTVEILGDAFDAGPDALVDAAAVMMQLDLVITSDTSIAHLAGALGRPVWVALKHVPDWRFGSVGEDWPSYRSARLFRQSRRGDWAGVFDRMAAELSRIAAKPAAPDLAAPLVPVSIGGLIDRTTILEIKAERIAEPGKLANIRKELALLSPMCTTLAGHGRRVNELLWEIEDLIRACERAGEFGADFVALARSVYRTNDRRGAIKRRINELTGSSLVEEKSYSDWS
jgi:hypothetical protein